MKDKAARQIKVDPSHVKQSTNRQVSIVAGEGDGDLAERAALLTRKWTNELDRLVLVVDADKKAPSDRVNQISASFRGRAPSYAGSFAVLVWDPTLEVVIERSLRLARPEPLASVDGFLKTAPGPARTGKEAAFTFCAAWEPDTFGETFYQQVWRMEDVRPHLQKALSDLEPHLAALL